jgi:3-deoxy-D-manno-octulosonate 8-phosphate phosphatase (KDO 8-P phosphatase)
MIKVPSKSINWENVQLVIFDCDGVLTDGRIIYDNEGMETKNFHAHDGMGFSLLHRAGLVSAVITGRTSKALEQRCKDLDIRNLYQGVQKKLKVAQKLLEKYRFSWQQTIYMGDDWNDIPVMQKCAMSACPYDAMPEIKHFSDAVTERKACEGAAREIIDFILYQKGIFEKVTQEYLDEIST